MKLGVLWGRAPSETLREWAFRHKHWFREYESSLFRSKYLGPRF